MARDAARNREEIDGEDEVAAFEDAVIRRGYYPFRTDPGQLASSRPTRGAGTGSSSRRCSSVEKWMALADERLGGTGIRVLLCPGNDDQFEVDEVIAAPSASSSARGASIDIDGFQMVSTGWANRTPWNTYREEDEPDLRGGSRRRSRT